MIGKLAAARVQSYLGQIQSRREMTIRVFVIAGVMLSASVLAPVAIVGNHLLLAVFALPIGVLALAVLMRWPGLGFPLVVIASLLVPISIGTGTQTGINATMLMVVLLIGLWIWDATVRQGEVRLISSPIVPPLIALMVVSSLSLGFGQLNWLPTRPASLAAQFGGLAIFILSPAAFLLIAHRLRNLKSLQWMVWLLIGLGGIFVSCLLVPSLRRPAFRIFQRAVLDSMFWTWIVTLAFSQSWLNQKLKPYWRIAIALVAIGAFYFTIVLRQSWTSGWLPAAISILTIVTVLKPKWIFFGAVAGGIGMLIQPQLIQSVFMGGDNEYSLLTRLEAWGILWEIIKLNPILGVGPANYYFYTPLFDILGYSVSFNSHNNYVDIIAQTGLAGLACFLWFAWEYGRVIWRLRTQMPDGFPRAYMYGALGGFVATMAAGMLGDWVLPFVYNVGLDGFRASGLAWMFLGAAIALQQMYPPAEKLATTA